MYIFILGKTGHRPGRSSNTEFWRFTKTQSRLQRATRYDINPEIFECSVNLLHLWESMTVQTHTLLWKGYTWWFVGLWTLFLVIMISITFHLHLHLCSIISIMFNHVKKGDETLNGSVRFGMSLSEIWHRQTLETQTDVGSHCFGVWDGLFLRKRWHQCCVLFAEQDQSDCAWISSGSEGSDH